MVHVIVIVQTWVAWWGSLVGHWSSSYTKKTPVNFLKLSESTMMKLCPNKSQQESIVFLYSNSESLYTRGSTLFINELIELNIIEKYHQGGFIVVQVNQQSSIQIFVCYQWNLIKQYCKCYKIIRQYYLNISSYIKLTMLVLQDATLFFQIC